MDWFFKSTSWDFGELQSQTDTSISSSNGLNNSSLKKKEDCSVDLKLGCVGDSLGIDGLLDVGSVTQLETKAAKSDPPKRARKVVISSQNINCSVNGCKSDLSGCRDYHKKHKVCEAHAKTPIVTVDGVQQRFCQQCSRFHLLKEFDEIKRSCRKRLAGHNRRRRKVQPDMDSANSISFFNGAGESFSLNPKIWTGNRKNGAWQGTSSVEHQPSANHLEQQTLFPLYSDNRRLSSSYQLHPNRITSSDSKSALSLLSLSNSSFDINALHSLQAERIPTAHPLIQTKCVTIYGGGDDWCFGKSSSQVSDYISTSSLISVERENQFRSFDEESTTLDIAAAQTEPVYSPPANGMSVFWTS